MPLRVVKQNVLLLMYFDVFWAPQPPNQPGFLRGSQHKHAAAMLPWSHDADVSAAPGTSRRSHWSTIGQTAGLLGLRKSQKANLNKHTKLQYYNILQSLWQQVSRKTVCVWYCCPLQSSIGAGTCQHTLGFYSDLLRLIWTNLCWANTSRWIQIIHQVIQHKPMKQQGQKGNLNITMQKMQQ